MDVQPVLVILITVGFEEHDTFLDSIFPPIQFISCQCDYSAVDNALINLVTFLIRLRKNREKIYAGQLVNKRRNKRRGTVN